MLSDPVLIAGEIIGGAFSAGATIYVARSANFIRKRQVHDQDEVERRKVDAEAYDRAKRIYEDLVDDLSTQLKNLRSQSHETQVEYNGLQRELWKEQNNVQALSKRIVDLQDNLQQMEAQITKMENTIMTLRQKLAVAGITDN